MTAKEIYEIETGNKIPSNQIAISEWIIEYRNWLEDVVVKNYSTPDIVKSLPSDQEVKAHIDTLPYYGTCTSEYNEGFEDGVKWIKEQVKQNDLIKEKCCNNCKHNGNQMIHPSACTGCSVDEEYSNHEYSR